MHRKPSLFTSAVLGFLVATTALAPAQDMLVSAAAAAPAKVAATANTASCSSEICLTSFGHNYGTVAAGSSTAYGVQLTNGTSTPFPFSLSLTGSSAFTSATNCGATVAAGASCEIVFTYTAPGTTQSDSASIAIATNGDTFTPASTGTLVGAVSSGAADAIVVSTQQHNFTAVNFGLTSSFGWNITNQTPQAVPIQLTPGGDTTDFNFQTNCPAILAASASCEVLVTYLPNSTSYQTATETIASTSPVYLKGTTTPANTLTVLGYGTGTIALNQAVKHVVVIFDENISFDHFFGTYPNAANTDGQTFTAASGTPVPNNYVSNPSLLTSNPNAENSANGNSAINPFRLDYTQAVTASQNHNYLPEQEAQDQGKMDLFPKYVGTADTSSYPQSSGAAATTGLNLGYYDGNVVTALWNYAQHYAMSDMSFGTGFGPSTNGAINAISGQTNGVGNKTGTANLIADGQGGYTLYGDDDPYGDKCSTTSGTTVQMTGKNIGDLLNAANIPWGGFMGGFNLGLVNSNGTTGCLRSTIGKSQAATGSVAYGDYIQHHAWFQYYASTANLQHLRPTATIGTTDQANHQYDSQDFFTALSNGILPAVSYLKAPAYQDAHAGYSNPLDEQAWITSVVNALQQSSFWPNTVVIVAYDDSDGWYDHYYQAAVNGSSTTVDALNGTSKCGTGTTAVLAGPNSNGNPVQGRCGYGPRLPFLVISPWSKANYIDHTVIDQSSIVRFIEDVFLKGQRLGGGSFDAQAGSITGMLDLQHSLPPNSTKLILSSTTGQPVSSSAKPATR